MINFENKYTFGVLSAVIISIILSLLFLGGAFESTSLRTSDVLYQDRSPLENVIIVAIDDSGLQKIGRWPWDRSVYVSFLDKTSGAKVIGFDVSFFEMSDKDQGFG